MKRFKLNRKGGFTLIEMVIVMVMMSIILTGVMLISSHVGVFFNKTDKWTSDKNTTNTISRALSERIRYADEVGIYNDFSHIGFVNRISADGIPDDYVVFIINNEVDGKKGRVYQLEIGEIGSMPPGDNKLIMPEDFYGNRSFVINFSKYTNSSINIGIEVFDKNNNRTLVSENTIAVENVRIRRTAVEEHDPDISQSGANTYIVFKQPDSSF